MLLWTFNELSAAAVRTKIGREHYLSTRLCRALRIRLPELAQRLLNQLRLLSCSGKRLRYRIESAFNGLPSCERSSFCDEIET